MDSKFIPYLTELAAKYSVAGNVQVELEEGAVKVSCDKGSYRFFYDFAKELPQDGYKNVPLYHWQLKRRYVELRNILDTQMVKNALAMRIHHIVSKDEFTKSLKDIIVFESNLVEFVTHQKVEKVFSDFSGDVYANCIMSTDGNVKVSILSMGSTSNYCMTGGKGNICHGFMAINPAFFGDPETIKQHFSTYLQELRESPKADGATHIYTHGEKEVAAVDRIMKNGVPVNDNTMVEVLDLCNYLGIDFGSYFGDYRPPVKEDVFKGNY